MIDNQELVANRHAWLLAQLAENRKVFTNAAASAFDVSVDTIRRDLRTLHAQGLLKRVHGGAVPVSPLPASFSGRSLASGPTDQLLASAVVERFRPGFVIGLDAGSTNVEIASIIPKTLAVTIVTNSPAAAMAMAEHHAATVILLGGQLDLTWMAAVGANVVDSWREYRLDIGVLGACGFDGAVGATTSSQAEVATKRALIAASSETILPLHADKAGVIAPFLIRGAGEIDTIVTNARQESAFAVDCRSTGAELVLV